MPLRGSRSIFNGSDPGLGISPHTDAGLATLLYQSPERCANPQLQMYAGTKEVFGDGSFFTIEPYGCSTGEMGLTVNVGDMLQVLTGGEIQAPEHRVLPTEGGAQPATFL